LTIIISFKYNEIIKISFYPLSFESTMGVNEGNLPLQPAGKRVRWFAYTLRVIVIAVIATAGIATGAAGRMLLGIYFPTEYSDRVYVTQWQGNTLSFVDVSNRDYRPQEKWTEITVGRSPFAVLVTLDGKKAYVTNGENALSVIDLVANKRMGTIPVPGNPTQFVMSPDGAHIYVIVNGAVLVIDAQMNVVMKAIPIGQNPLGIAICPNGTQVYVTNGDNGTVSVIDTKKNEVVGRISVGGPSYGVAFTPDGTRAYVTVLNSDSVIIDIENRTVTGKINVPPGLDLIAITPDGTKAYISNGQDTLYVLHIATNTLIDSISFGIAIPFGIAINRDSTRVYITNVQDNTLLVIDTVTNKVIYTILLWQNTGTGGVAIGPVPQ
jgi:YVTN family beta-propeller protein